MTPIRFRIRELREAQGLSQQALGDLAGVRQATISDLENDHVRRLNLTALEAIANALNVDAATLLVHERGKKRPMNPTLGH